MTNEERASRSAHLAQFITRLPRRLSKHLWVWPLLLAVLIALVGLWVRNRVEGTMKAELVSRLQTVLNADIAALQIWFTEQKFDVKSFAADTRIQGAIEELAALAQTPNVTTAALANSPPAQTLRTHLQSLLEAQHYLDYVVVSPDKRILASPHPRLVNLPAPRAYDWFLDQALDGQLAVSRPFARELTLYQQAEGPTMFVAAPVKSTNGVVIAVLGLRMKPEGEFSRIFSVARMGETGEAYAFDRRGVMLTASRFDGQLRMLGLIPNVPRATSILTLRLLDPEADLQRGEKPPKPRSELHLTRMAAAAIGGASGHDVEGYRNYRGVKVVGAWAWLPEYSMGVATEVATDEAFQTLDMLRQAFLVLFVLLVLSGGAIFAFTLIVKRLEASVRRTTLTARRLGQYVLIQEIGRGADGMVYRARHALLRRPVAVKLLSPEMTNETNAARFEHEVQMTSQLTHPNTVAIYDYGRTPEGLFYYAMEYLSGIDLHRLVKEFGPQPEGRIIHILRQVCGSLAEAHRIGLIHRDIKPANIVLTRRGGLCDVAKVLDFGVVKTVRLDHRDGPGAEVIVGTPHFMPPEAIEKPLTVDSRSDLYSVGAVGYWLLTGCTLFEDVTVESLLKRQVHSPPPPPSERLRRHVSADLEQLIMQCLAKSPDRRPLTAEALDAALAACEAAVTWSSAHAAQWWAANLRTLEAPVAPAMPEKTLIIAPRP